MDSKLQEAIAYVLDAISGGAAPGFSPSEGYGPGDYGTMNGPHMDPSAGYGQSMPPEAASGAEQMLINLLARGKGMMPGANAAFDPNKGYGPYEHGMEGRQV